MRADNESEEGTSTHLLQIDPNAPPFSSFGGAVASTSPRQSVNKSQDAGGASDEEVDDEDEDDYFEDVPTPAPAVGRNAVASGAAAAANAADEGEVFSQLEQQKLELEQRLGLDHFLRAYEIMQVCSCAA